MPIHKMSFPQGKLHRLSWQCVIGRTDFKNKYENRKHDKKAPFFLVLSHTEWYKEWKVLRGCVEKFGLGRCQGLSNFPKEKSDYPRDLREKIGQTIPWDFPLLVRLWASKTKEGAAQSCPMCLSGEAAVQTCTSLTVLNPDFGG